MTFKLHATLVLFMAHKVWQLSGKLVLPYGFCLPLETPLKHRLFFTVSAYIADCLYYGNHINSLLLGYYCRLPVCTIAFVGSCRINCAQQSAYNRIFNCRVILWIRITNSSIRRAQSCWGWFTTKRPGLWTGWLRFAPSQSNEANKQCSLPQTMPNRQGF